MKVKVTKNEFKEPIIKATITIEIEAYFPESDERTEIDEDEAKDLIFDRLGDLASSNDGSELLANVPKENISFAS
jgi:hypothetical protein